MILRLMAAMFRGVVVSHERDGRAVFGRQVQRGSRHEDAPARERLGGVLERRPHRGVVVSHERDGRAVLGRQVQRGSRHEDAAARERLGGVLERVPHRDVVVSHERDVRAVLGRQVQRGSRHEDAPVRLDGEPLEHQSQSGDGEELGSLLDDLENASGSYLAVEASKSPNL